jgi:hypothetical protein
VNLDRANTFAGKKVARTEDPPVEAEIEANSEEEDATLNETEGDASVQEQDIVMGQQGQEEVPPVSGDRRTTFTFTMDAPTADDLPDYESLDGHEHAPAEEATLPKFFRSPVKAATTRKRRSREMIEYPQLPLSDDHATEVEMVMEAVATKEVAEVVEEEVIPEGVECPNGFLVHVDEVHPSEAKEEELPVEEAAAATSEISYPALPLAETTSPAPPATLDEDIGEMDDEAELSEVELDAPAAGELSEHIASSPETDDTNVEFTEASLQLNILREYQEALRANGVTPSEEGQPQVDSNTPSTKQDPEPEDDGNVYFPRDPETVLMDVLEGMGMEAGNIALVQAALRPSPEPSDGAQPQPSSSYQDVDMGEASTEDIADGLVLSFTPVKAASSPAPRKLHSPPPPPRSESGPDDATMTLAIDDDTAILKDFLTRAAASKAEKAAVTTHRRESLQNRRDSDVIRHALASPRKVLEEKDPNSPNKYDNELTLDLSQTLTLGMPTETLDSPTSGAAKDEGTEDKEAKGSRRSSRTKMSRLPAPSSISPGPPKIAIRRADGAEVVVLKKDDTKALTDLTRNNTRKNKQGAFGVTVRLMKIAMESGNLPPIDDATKELIVGKNVRWDETMAYYQEHAETLAYQLAEAESLATPDELGFEEMATPKKKTSKNSTPKIRRVRGLGAGNGTPGKGLLAPSSLLPKSVQQEQDIAAPKSKKKSKMPVSSSSSITPTSLPALDVAPVGVVPGQRKSRLAAPRKVVLPTPASATGEGKENEKKSASKIGLPIPKITVPTTTTANAVGMESGLPRRRGRKY